MSEFDLNFFEGGRTVNADGTVFTFDKRKVIGKPVPSESVEHVRVVECEDCGEHLLDVVIDAPTKETCYYTANCPACGDHSPLVKVVGKQHYRSRRDCKYLIVKTNPHDFRDGVRDDLTLRARPDAV